MIYCTDIQIHMHIHVHISYTYLRIRIGIRIQCAPHTMSIGLQALGIILTQIMNHSKIGVMWLLETGPQGRKTSQNWVDMLK